MAFDQPTRNRLARFVGEARALLSEEFTRQLQHEYGLDPDSGRAADLAQLTHLDDARRETARILRETLDHYLAGAAKPTTQARHDALDRIVREQAYTVLNRLCALRMAEARGLLIESVSKGYQSRGFQLYVRLAGTALGETGDAYRSYLFSLFDEFAVDLAVLFDRFSPQGRLFPREAALLRLLDEVNHPDIEPLWAEDETIGWIYQYFNSDDERRQMRAESQAPRNSRELAVRNQFFTPRYVVEFLTDNTLGRIWYEMTQGQTDLVNACRYLVRRPVEVFLRDPERLPVTPRAGWVKAAARGDLSQLPEDPSFEELSEFCLVIDGYGLVERLGYGHCITWADRQIERYRESGTWPGSSLKLWLILFRQQRYWGRASHIEDTFYDEWRSAYRAFRASLDTEDLSQEELLQQPLYIPYRPLKDPREITMLDPACGSMHFGLYAFDLYERIYDEAWDMQAGRQWAELRGQTDEMRLLTADYPSKDAFLRDVPRLIIEHNIHGIDIDPRAVQIAGLSLWLRAQKSWQAQGLKPQERPQIRRSSVVCAEPMPGDKGLLDEFLRSLRDDRLEALIRRVLDIPAGQRVRATEHMAEVLCDLVRTVWQGMSLAGEAGSLLRIEESLAEAVAKAEAEWKERWPLFHAEFQLTEGASQIRYLRRVPGEGTDFWSRAEALVLAALRDYAEQAQADAGYLRRLFAEDAAQGFAFIDLCRKCYDVVCMNPPFGGFPRDCKLYAKVTFPNTCNDIFGAFIQRFLEQLEPSGLLGAITSRNGFFLGSFVEWRQKTLLAQASLDCLADLGNGVMDDAMVEAAAYCIGRSQPFCASVFFRLLGFANREQNLVRAVEALHGNRKNSITFLADRQQFDILPDSPFVYWVPKKVLKRFADMPKLEPTMAQVRQGLVTGDNFRFVRMVWEVPPENLLTRNASGMAAKNRSEEWAFLVMTGASQPWYSPIMVVVNWTADGAELKNFRDEKGKLKSRPQNTAFYFRPGFSWTLRAVRFIPYIIPSGCIATASRYMAFPEPGHEYTAIGLTASNVASAFLRFYGEMFERPKYLVENVKALPLPTLPPDLAQALETLVWHQATQRRHSYQNWEPFHEFTAPSVCFSTPGLDALAFDRCSLLGTDLDASVARTYGLDPGEQTALERDLQEAIAAQRPSDESDDEDGRDFVLSDTRHDQQESLLSYVTGCTFGRWDIRYATGERSPPRLLDPFAPLPACSPGLLQNAEGFPAKLEDVSPNYPLRISWAGILVDDPGHPEDIQGRTREALRVIWGERADAVEQEACEILGLSSLRAYSGDPNRFFDDHLKRYSKSRRYAPIYWPLSAPSGNYTLWLYYHRLGDQILYTCVNDFVDPKIEQVQREAHRLRQTLSRSSDEERELERLTDLALELQDFRGELLRVAAFWKPNLNDGVQITAAPLWRLFQHRGWQKRLQETWEALEAGNYDWAHLAMSVWPARVVPKCVDDHSFAIAHSLEDLFWVEDVDGWRNLCMPNDEIADHKQRRQALSRHLLRDLLAELAGGAGRGLPAYQVCQHLTEGDWDDMRVALCLWPERVAEKCWADPSLSFGLELYMPTKRTQAARKRFVVDLVSAGTPDLADAFVAALQEAETPFDALWAELERGDRDGEPLALALWPERVVDKCVTDVDLAARHDLRRFFWYKPPYGDWRRRKDLRREVADEIARRQTNTTQGGR